MLGKQILKLKKTINIINKFIIIRWELTLILTSREGLFKGFYIEIRHKVVAKNNFSPLFVLYALKDRKIKLTPRILCHRKIFR